MITHRNLEAVLRACRNIETPIVPGDERLENALDMNPILIADLTVELAHLGLIELDEHEEVIVNVPEITGLTMAALAAYP